MQKALLLFLLCSTSIVFAQTRRLCFLDENGHCISTDKFYQKQYNDVSKYLRVRYETDNALTYKIVYRENTGNLNREAVQDIRRRLENAAHVTIDTNQILVIDYYPGKDPCNASTSATPTFLRKLHRQYRKQLDEIGGVGQFNVYGDSSGLFDKYYGAVEWYPDLDHRITNTFFPEHYPCGSFVVIHPNGHYYAYYGEYATYQVFEAVRAADGRNKGLLHPDSLRMLRAGLHAASGEEIEPDKYLVIRYYPGKDEYSSGGDATAADIKRYHKTYLRKLHATAPVQHLAIYDDPEGIDRFRPGMDWYPDVQHRVRNLFFPERYPGFSAVIIAPDGSYSAIYGEHSHQRVLSELKQLSESKSVQKK